MTRDVSTNRKIYAEECERADAPAVIVNALRNGWLDDEEQGASSVAALAAMERSNAEAIAPFAAAIRSLLKAAWDLNKSLNRQFETPDDFPIHPGIEAAEQFLARMKVSDTPKVFGMAIRAEGAVPPGSIEFHHPGGRVDRFKLE